MSSLQSQTVSTTACRLASARESLSKMARCVPDGRGSGEAMQPHSFLTSNSTKFVKEQPHNFHSDFVNQMLKKVDCSTLRGHVMPLVNFSPGSALMEINNTRDRLLNPINHSVQPTASIQVINSCRDLQVQCRAHI
jgi:hypothetical protein